MDFKKACAQIEKKIAYSFKDKSLLKQAFTRKSYSNENRGIESNEVLEFLGDSVLSLCIATLFMKAKSKRYENGLSTEWTEGDFSNVKSKLSDKKNLSVVTERLGLSEYLLLGEGDRKLGIGKEASVNEDLFESIIGAIYVDSDYQVGAVISVVDRLLNLKEYQKSDTPPLQSYKNALQEWCAAREHRLSNPVYKTISESGPDHKKSFKRAVFIGEKMYGVGEGKNQKAADTEAARISLEMLKAETRGKSSLRANEPSPATRLKELAASERKASPTYRDRGESEKSSEKMRVYLIECSYDGVVAVGEGESKSIAKENAILKVLDVIKKSKAKPKACKKTVGASPKKQSPKAKKSRA